LATKAVGKVVNAPWDQGASRKHLFEAIDHSLRRLQTDYVDLYQLHSDDTNTPLDETIEALDAIVSSGKVRYIGISNFLAYRLSRALGKADTRRLTRFISVQPRYNLLFRQIEGELLPLAQEEGVAVIPYNPLAGGLLTGKHSPNQKPASGTRFTLAAAAKVYQDRYWHDREFSTVQKLQDVAKEAGIPLTTLALAWVLANPIITAPIIGASRPEQLADNFKALEIKLDADLKDKLDHISAEYRLGDALR